MKPRRAQITCRCDEWPFPHRFDERCEARADVEREGESYVDQGIIDADNQDRARDMNAVRR
jgi:hypothetical protein